MKKTILMFMQCLTLMAFIIIALACASSNSGISSEINNAAERQKKCDIENGALLTPLQDTTKIDATGKTDVTGDLALN